MASSEAEKKSDLGVPGRVIFLDGRGELPMLEVSTAWSTAEIYLQGAHVTHFTRKNEPPLLFLSQCSRFEEHQPIRGGIPVIFPWFGPREGLPQHGFARLKAWELKEFAFENCLHTYFEVGAIAEVSITGLKGARYLDRLANLARKTESADAIRIASEVDRTYLDAVGAVEILDPRLRRKIRVEKEGSASTVVWNPWIAKSQQMPDFANDEYQRMVCVESGNVASNNLN